MKKLILTTALSVGVAIGAFAQGQITIDNTQATSNSPTALASGFVFTNNAGNVGLELNNVSLSITGGPNAGTQTLIATLLANSGQIVAGNNAGQAGVFLDLSASNVYPVSGVALNATAVLDVQFWEGNFSSYAAAKAANALVGDTGFFNNPTGGGGTITPADLIGMPSVQLSVVPEPTTIVLGGLGAAALLLFRRRKQ
jgi:hypothetical protein